MRYEVNAVINDGGPKTDIDPDCIKTNLCHTHLVGMTTSQSLNMLYLGSLCMLFLVGGSSQANHLMRNSAMDDSIGGS